MSKEITLNQALKLKNKIKKRISDKTALLLKSNSVASGTKKAFSSVKLFDEIEKDKNELIKLKAKIQKANNPILEDIYCLSEIKDTCKFLKSMNTTNGVSTDWRRGIEALEFEAEMTEDKVVQMISELENDIDSIQEKIDQFNFSTKIEI